MNTQDYFSKIDREVHEVYDVAKKARAIGIDPKNEPEIVIAKNMAERVVGLITVVAPEIGSTTIISRIKELEEIYGAQDWRVALTMAYEVASDKFCKFETKLKSMEIGIRLGIAYITNGVVSSPLEGFTELKIKKRRDGGEYFALYFSGPMRSAGGTAESVSVLIGDYVRRKMGYLPYDPEEKEIKRTYTELYDYHDRITNLQYLPSEEEISFIVSRLPVQVDGEPSEKLEASNYKGLDRIETDKLRNGVCLVIGEGICQKAAKLYKNLSKWGKDFGLEEWIVFLGEFVELQKKKKAKEKEKEPKYVGLKPDHTFIKDIVAGRPVLTDPMTAGGFRLRYGRTRVSGLSAQSMHPATMTILGDFIAIGTQLKLERPGKSTVISPCDKLEGPLVKLTNGNVVYLDKPEEARKLIKDVEEIIYLGDLLISYGDFFNRGHVLAPAGYCEEWWALEVEKAAKEKGREEEFKEIIQNPWKKVSFSEALEISEALGIPLHPKHTFYWEFLNFEDIRKLQEWLHRGAVQDEKVVLPIHEDIPKRALEILGVPHKVVTNEYIVIEGDAAKSFSFILSRIDLSKKGKDVYELLPKEIVLRKKGGTFIGARMGRPEKSKIRKLKGSPQVLFPVGNEGGRLRSFQSALEVGSIQGEFPIFYCRKCSAETIYPLCESCGTLTEKKYICPLCGVSDKQCHEQARSFKNWKLDVNKYFRAAVRQAGISLSKVPPLIKGVRGTSNKDHTPEPLAKGLLRAVHNLYVNKDGTIRFDMTELPITHFRPREIGTSVEKLQELGYEKDIHGDKLENENQVLELFIQDVILPSTTESLDETSDKVFIRIAQFIDALLVNVYGQKPFYNVTKVQDLVGHLVLGLAPHISAGTVGRIIGFSKTQAFFAHPFFHCSVRRDCDGDELCIMFILDALLNFSRSYLPSHRGGTQDAPLVLTSTITSTEVDDMVFDMDIAWKYPLVLYEGSLVYKNPWDVPVEQLKKRLGSGREYSGLGYTHETEDINAGPQCSAYKSLPTMEEKVHGQMELAERIRAVDKDKVARLVIERHFMRDLLGNLRKFSSQVFRCVKCNEKFRRPPLAGSCLKCGGRIIYTVSQGSIVKYLEPSLELAAKYVDSPYLKQTLELTKLRIESIFGKAEEKQEGLAKFF